MRHATRVVLVTLGLAAVSASGVEAQRRSHFGARAGYDVDIEEFAMGAQLNVPVGRRLDFAPSVDRYFIDPGSLWSVNADLKFQPTSRADWLYVGSGLNVMNRKFNDASKDTDAGLNLLVGVQSQRGWIHPFADARLTTLTDADRVLLAAGVNITLGRRSSALRASAQPR